MPKTNDKTAAQAGTQAQLPDSKGVNPTRDARRRKGGAGLPMLPKGGGTGKFRKSRRVPE
jgi:hypothetical protein